MNLISNCCLIGDYPRVTLEKNIDLLNEFIKWKSNEATL